MQRIGVDCHYPPYQQGIMFFAFLSVCLSVCSSVSEKFCARNLCAFSKDRKGFMIQNAWIILAGPGIVKTGPSICFKTDHLTVFVNFGDIFHLNILPRKTHMLDPVHSDLQLRVI